MISNQNEKVNYIEIILILMFILYIIDFYGVGFYCFILFIPLIFFYSWREKFNKLFLITLAILMLFGFTFSYIIYSFEFSGFETTIISVIFPVAMYAVGYSLSEEDYEYKKVYKVIFLLLLSLSIFVFLSYIKTLSLYGDLETAKNIYNERALAGLWTEDEIKATVVTVYLSFGLAALPTLFIQDATISKKKLLMLKCIIFLCFISSIYITVQMASRTSVIIAIFSFFFVYLLAYKMSIKKFLIPFISFLIIMFAWFLFNLNVFNLKNWWIGTSVYTRFQTSGLESGRYDAWMDVIQGIINYPLGGREINLSISYAHNLWLDVAYDAGLLPFVLLLVFTIIAFISFIKFIKLEHPIFLKSLLISFYTAFFICFMTEPILATKERFYFIIFCLIVGITQGLNRKLKNKKLQLNNQKFSY